MWKVLGGSVVGRAHATKSLPCQDASGWHSGENCTCLVIADGAGSRSHSEKGAQTAVAAMLGWAASLTEVPQLEHVRDAFALARAAVETEAGAAELPAEDFACTLATVLICQDAFYFVQVGDSLAFVRRLDGSIFTVEPPGRSEYINETTFLTSDEWDQALRLSELPGGDVESVAVSTDGLQFEILSDVQASLPYVPFFDDAFAWAETDSAQTDGLMAFIDQLDDQSGDDKTLLLAVRTECSEDQSATAAQAEPREETAPI
jgi:hypothetical protein